METFSALLAICAGNSPASGEFPVQRPVMRSFDVFFDLRLNKRLSKISWDWWFETLSCPLWRQCNGVGKLSVSAQRPVMQTPIKFHNDLIVLSLSLMALRFHKISSDIKLDSKLHHEGQALSVWNDVIISCWCVYLLGMMLLNSLALEDITSLYNHLWISLWMKSISNGLFIIFEMTIHIAWLIVMWLTEWTEIKYGTQHHSQRNRYIVWGII